MKKTGASKRTVPSISATLLLVFGQQGAAAEIVHDYSVSVDPELSVLRVEARFSKPITSVTARAREAGRLLLDVQDCDANERLLMRNRRMMLPASGIRCMNYTVDLERAAREERRNRYLLDDNVVVSPSRWLWRPELMNGTALRVRFRLPEGIGVAVPWRPVDGAQNEYLLGESPESANAPALFGTFGFHELLVPGATLRVGLPRSDPALDDDAILDWLTATATDVSLTYGRFPNPLPFVIVMPIGTGRPLSKSAVPFGRVIRDGGEAIELFVDQRKTREDFMSDWTATHEFSHLMLPYLGKRHKWISEGFAQYYQNVLLARSGAYEQREAWQKLYDGLRRGRESRPELSPNEAAERGVRGARMKVYWSGAAIALMADVAIRERMGGAESLDVVLDRIQSCCLPSERVWSGPELFATLDSLIDAPTFLPLYRRHADTAGFPDTSELFERLGLPVQDGRVRLRANAELSALRNEITEPHPETARWRLELASD